MTTYLKYLLLLGCALLLLFGPRTIPFADHRADAYFDTAIQQATVVYGTSRFINASVSLIKESDVSVQPAGLGVSVAAGQVLDPLDDMTERASDILVTAIIALGIQKLAYEFTVAFSPPLLGILLLSCWAISFLPHRKCAIVNQFAWKLILLLVIARICLPVSALLSAGLQEYYFVSEIEKAEQKMKLIAPQQMNQLKKIDIPEADGAWDLLKKNYEFVTHKTDDLRIVFKTMLNNMDKLITSLLKISYLYIGLFLIQVILLPLATFWILIKLVNQLFGANMPVLFSHRALPRRQMKNE